MTETSIKNNEELEKIKDKLLELRNDRGIGASYLLCLLSKIINPEHTSQFILVKVPNSNRVKNILINNTIPVTLYHSLLIFRDTDEKFELKAIFLK